MTPEESMTDDIAFEKLIAEWSAAEQFLARRTRAIEKRAGNIEEECKRRAVCGMPISTTPHFSRKQIAVGASGVSALAIIINAILYVLSRVVNAVGSISASNGG